MKPTQWFKHDCVPPCRGVYQRFDGGAYYSKWDDDWFYYWVSVEKAAKEKNLSLVRVCNWRALLTDWFPWKDRPVHEGIYQVNYIGYLMYAKWSNGLWSIPHATIAKAAKETVRSVSQRFDWRGIQPWKPQ